MPDEKPVVATPAITSKPFPQPPEKKFTAPGPVVLLILDGWGIGPDYPGNAIRQSQTPNMDRYPLYYPHTQLGASGESVGLPPGVDGNSETGHTNIGAGSVIWQDLPRIDGAIADGSFNQIPAFLSAMANAKQPGKRLHLLGLVGGGFVHASTHHLYALLALAKEQGLTEVFIHVITDGRDSPPTMGTSYIQRLQEHCRQLGLGTIASVMGRFYAMDRDKRWDRVEQAYDLLTSGAPLSASDPIQALQQQYDQKISDEYMPPTNIHPDGSPPVLIQDGDSVIFFNYRVDRPRELTRAFVLPSFEQGTTGEDYDPFFEKYHHTSIQQPATPSPTFVRKKVLQDLHFVTMTVYEKNLPVEVAFTPTAVPDNVGRVLSEAGVRQLRLTETEKERMVTFYMNGQHTQANPGEDWVIFPSKGARSYAEVPEMSAREITLYLLQSIQEDRYDVYIVNIANGDMVGHTGDLPAGITACAVVDQQVGQIVEAVLAKNGTVLITADHGNIEEMINMETGEPDTEHSTFPVPFIVVDRRYENNPVVLAEGVLADIVPTILTLLHIKKPDTMSGRTLLVEG